MPKLIYVCGRQLSSAGAKQSQSSMHIPGHIEMIWVQSRAKSHETRDEMRDTSQWQMRLNELCLMAFQVEMRLKCNLKCKTFPLLLGQKVEGKLLFPCSLRHFKSSPLGQLPGWLSAKKLCFVLFRLFQMRFYMFSGAVMSGKQLAPGWPLRGCDRLTSNVLENLKSRSLKFMRPRWTIKTPLPVGQWRQVSEKAAFGSRLAKNNFMSAKKFPAASLPFIFQSVVPFVTSVCRTKNYDTSTPLLFSTTTKHNLCVGIGRSLGIGMGMGWSLPLGCWMQTWPTDTFLDKRTWQRLCRLLGCRLLRSSCFVLRWNFTWKSTASKRKNYFN